MFIEADVLNGLCEGSFEHRIALIEDILESEKKGASIVATHEDGAIVVDEDKIFFRMTVNTVSASGDGWETEKNRVVVFEEIKVPVVEHVEAYVARELRRISEDVMDDVDVRNRLHELSKLLKRDEVYWIEDVIDGLNDSMNEEWMSFYSEHKDDVRGALKGQLRSTEGQIPRTRFSKLKESRLDDCGDELKESLNILSGLMKQIVDECTKVVFDGEDEELCAIRDLLIGEARAVDELLGKAKRLMLSEVSKKMAETHDTLAERAKTMMVVSEYLKKHRAEENQE